MQNFKESLRFLVTLQDKDVVLDALRRERDIIPQKIDEYRAALDHLRSEIDASKQGLTQLQLQRKEKEIELESKETEIRKHSTELNAIKTNDAYRALLSEIDKCKQGKALLEDGILDIMEKIEAESAHGKDREKEFKKKEEETRTQIAGCEAELAKVKGDIERFEAERNEFARQISEEVLKKYEYIRSARSGMGIVPIEGETCSGCHITLRPQIINEVFKEQEFIFCDVCSRILFKK